MSDYDTPRLAELLAAGRGAVERARYVLVAITVAGGLILSAQFNLYYPWLRNKIALDPKGLNSEEQATQRSIRDFIYKDLQNVSVPIIGVKFSAYDLSVIGSLAMLILAIWFYYSLRRENHVVNRIFNVALEGEDNGGVHTDASRDAAVGRKWQRARYLYDALVHHFVFNPLGEAAPVPRWAIRAMFFMPFWVPLVVALIDFCSLWYEYKLGLPANRAIWGPNYKKEKWEGVWRCFHGVVIAVISGRIMYSCNQFHWNTRETLNVLGEYAGVKVIAEERQGWGCLKWWDWSLIAAMALLAGSFLCLVWYLQ
jgi:hypothetical protein